MATQDESELSPSHSSFVKDLVSIPCESEVEAEQSKMKLEDLFQRAYLEGMRSGAASATSNEEGGFDVGGLELACGRWPLITYETTKLYARWFVSGKSGKENFFLST